MLLPERSSMVREDCDGVASQANVASACPGLGMLGTKERGEENVLCCVMAAASALVGVRRQ